jgi:uncharacterized membrane protein YfcA
VATVALLAGALQSLAGFGFSLLAAPILAFLLPPASIAPLLIVLTLPLNALIALRGRRQVNLKSSWPLFLTGAVFTAPGAMLLVVASAATLKAFIGFSTIGAAVMLSFGIRLSTRRPRAWLAAAGVVSGLLNGSVTYSGPPVILLFSAWGLPKDEFRSRLTAYFLWLNLVTIPTFAIAGLLREEVLMLSLLCVPALLVGVFVGMRLADRIGELHFQRFVLVVAAGLGLAAAASGLSSCRSSTGTGLSQTAALNAEREASAFASETASLEDAAALPSTLEAGSKGEQRPLETVAALRRCEVPWWAQARPCETLERRIAPPRGYERKAVLEGSFGAFLRGLPLLPSGAEVHLFDGTLKANQGAHVEVIDIDVGKRDLQQCADAVMRLWAEYLYGIGRASEVCFRSAAGQRLSFDAGNRTAFRKYLDKVFGKANTASLLAQLALVKNPEDVELGDVFIVPASGRGYGHAVVVVDLSIGPSGDKVFLLAQSYMPAQQMHVLRNPSEPELSPWYRVPTQALVTPEWTFPPDSLRRFVGSGCSR